MIKPIEKSEEEAQKLMEENTKEDLQPTDYTIHALVGHANPQVAKVEESLKQQLVTILIETRSINNFMNSKEKMRSLFVEFSIGQPSSPRKSQHGENSDRRYDPQEHGHIIPDQNNPCMKVEFPRWEEGDPIEWILHMEHYIWFYRTADGTRVEIVAFHLEGDAIQWFNWFEHTHEGLSW
ncbi:hypothetical protein BHE74_00033422 [Ensete ventricosum]|nr:hypothetical protein GW17_00038600 [Ensete ventricosum]RWW59626.1 hypothetical protein BHE74_00033422 [Ensete ventricosum]RZR95373.1 hypothetical protein BHM03_00024222 [Ensete ventricosum]